MEALVRAPTNVVHVLARMVPLATAFLVRANVALWNRHGRDTAVWSEAVKWLQSTERGWGVLWHHARAIFARWPALRSVVPMPICANAQYFDLTHDCTRIVCARGESYKVVDRVSLCRLDGFDRDFDCSKLVCSTFDPLLACMSDCECVRLRDAPRALTSHTERIYLHDTAVGKSVATLRSDKYAWRSFVFLPNGVFLAGALEGVIVVWDPPYASPRDTLSATGEHTVCSMAASSTCFASGALVFLSSRRWPASLTRNDGGEQGGTMARCSCGRTAGSCCATWRATS